VKHKVLETPKALLHYRQYGKGPMALLCFHGYGQDHDVYRELEELYGNKYTIYSFDLFYHGQSFWHNKEQPVEKADWSYIMEQFFAVQKIERFSLVGYSMGSRFALATFDVYADRVDQLILLAPDGIKRRFLYWLMTSFGFTRHLLRIVVTNPKPYLWLMETLLVLRLINKGVTKFSETQMKTRAARRRVYYSWIMFRKLFITPRATAEKIKKHEVTLKIFMGEFDKVITISQVQPLLDVFPKSLRIIPAGHTQLLKMWIQTYGAL
jgi:pimeloyl-ACP methyl ester carboxylesterase